MGDAQPSRRHPFRRRNEKQAEEAHDAAPPASPADDARDERGRRASLAAAARRGVRRGGQGLRAGLNQVAERIIDAAPRVPVRDLEALRAQFPGLGPDEIADKLIAGAVRSSATVGAGVGAAAMMPVPPAMPTELAVEITGVALVEFKLIAELHEVYGLRAPGSVGQRAAAYLTAWTEERGIDITRPMSLNAALGGRMKQELRQQLLKRMVRNVPNLAPFMIGAAVGALMNRRDTRRLADKIRDDLRARSIPWASLPAQRTSPERAALDTPAEGPAALE